MATDAHSAITSSPLDTNVALLAGYVFGPTTDLSHATEVFDNLTLMNTGLSTNMADTTQVVS